MPGQLKWTTITDSGVLLTTAGTVAAAAQSAAATEWDNSGTGTRFTRGIFELTLNYSVAPSAGAFVTIYAQTKQGAGTISLNKLPIKAVDAPTTTGSQTVRSDSVELDPVKYTFYIQNDTTQTLQIGATLKIQAYNLQQE